MTKFWENKDFKSSDKMAELARPLLSDYTPDVQKSPQAQLLEDLPRLCDSAMYNAVQTIKNGPQLDKAGEDICIDAMENLIKSIKYFRNISIEGDFKKSVYMRCLYSLEALKSHELAAQTQQGLGITDDELAKYYSAKINKAVDNLLSHATRKQIQDIERIESEIKEGVDKEKKEKDVVTPIDMYNLYSEVFDDRDKNLRDLKTSTETLSHSFNKHNDVIKQKILEASQFPPAQEKIEKRKQELEGPAPQVQGRRVL